MSREEREEMRASRGEAGRGGAAAGAGLGAVLVEEAEEWTQPMLAYRERRGTKRPDRSKHVNALRNW
jgi:hypothetical protein